MSVLAAPIVLRLSPILTDLKFRLFGGTVFNPVGTGSPSWFLGEFALDLVRLIDFGADPFVEFQILQYDVA